MADILAESGLIFFGSRLKRLAERFQAGASRSLADLDIPVQLAHLPLLAALARGKMTVGELADTVGAAQPGVTRSVGQLTKQGLARSAQGTDKRERYLELTETGREMVERAEAILWPKVEGAMEELCGSFAAALLEQLAALEVGLARESLDRRIQRAEGPAVRIVDYTDADAEAFKAINLAWIQAMFEVEPRDREVLEHPRESILKPGGVILLAQHRTKGIIGTGALERNTAGVFELTKMAVRKDARGLKTGELLLQKLLARAKGMGAREVFLLSNRRCAAAVHLYEKAGFVHDAEILHEHGSEYARCDVAMRYRWPAEGRRSLGD